MDIRTHFSLVSSILNVGTRCLFDFLHPIQYDITVLFDRKLVSISLDEGNLGLKIFFSFKGILKLLSQLRNNLWFFVWGYTLNTQFNSFFQFIQIRL